MDQRKVFRLYLMMRKKMSSRKPNAVGHLVTFGQYVRALDCTPLQTDADSFTVLQPGLITQANGSAYIETEKTKIACAVYV